MYLRSQPLPFVFFGFVCALVLGLTFSTSVRVYGQELVRNDGGGVASSSLLAETTDVVTPYTTEQLFGVEDVVGDFVVGPGKIELSIKPGETKIVEITVSNRTGAPRIFELGAEDVMGSNNSSETLVLLGSDRGPYSLKDYLSVKAPRFELGHNMRARIPVTVSIPADAEPGGLYGSMLVSTVSKEAHVDTSDGTAPQSAVVARIGTLFFITIPGDVLHSGELTEFDTIGRQRFFGSGPTSFGLLYENTGSIHLAPYGEVRIKNMFGEEVGFVELEPWFVLPKAERLREIRWDREMLFGRYSATARINRSYDDVIDEKSVAFWILPWKPLALVFVGIFVVALLLRLFFRQFEFRRKS